MTLNNSSANYAGFIRGVRTASTTYIGLEIGSETNHGIRFLTNGTADAAERMRIDASGNVGIGSASPTQKLDVVGNVNVSGTLTAANIVGTVTGNIPANQVIAGSFQNAAYTFPNNLAVTGTLTQGGSNVITQANIASNAVTSLNTQKGDLTLSAGFG